MQDIKVENLDFFLRKVIFVTNVFYILKLDLQTWERGRFSESSNSGDSGISHKKYSLSATIQKYYFF